MKFDAARISVPVVLLGLLVGACGGTKEGAALLDKPAEPFGPLTKLRFGMTDHELVDAAPEFTIECTTSCTAKAVVGQVTYRARLLDVHRRVFEMSATFDGVKPEALFERWGNGTRVAWNGLGAEGEVVFYSNAARTMRAWIKWMNLSNDTVTTVEFRPLVPLESLIDPKQWTVAGIELLDRTPGDVRQAATEKGYLPETDRIVMPPTELGSMDTTTWFDTNGDKITKYWIYLDTANVPDAKQTVLATLARTFGKPTAASGDWLVYPGARRVRSRDADGHICLEIALPDAQP